jgi:hypothetical protein
MISSEFSKAEYWMIKWPLLALLLSIVLVSGLFLGLNAIETAAAAELRRVRSDLDEARDNVEKIEEEEQTIIKNIGRYRIIMEDGVVMPEDRLQFQERLLEIRAENELFPVGLNVGIQTHLPLQYSEGRTERGKEIVLNMSPVDIKLPLLHEDDLTRLLLALMNGPGLLQPLKCSLTANSTLTANFIYLAQHFDAACTLQLYTFQLPPEPPRPEERP